MRVTTCFFTVTNQTMRLIVILFLIPPIIKFSSPGIYFICRNLAISFKKILGSGFNAFRDRMGSEFK